MDKYNNKTKNTLFSDDNSARRTFPADKFLAELFLTEVQFLFLLEREIKALSTLEKQNMRHQEENSYYSTYS